MLPLAIPPGTTIESLVTTLIPEAHSRLVVEGGPLDSLTIAVRILGSGCWTLRIRGREMHVSEGEDEHVTLWLCTRTCDVERFLEDALGPGRLTPSGYAGDVATMTDPKVIRRVAMASGRLELGVHDESGGRMAMVLGFGSAARRPIDPNDADVLVEVSLAIVEGVLRGRMAPVDALSHGNVTVRGNRFLALQLALALAPFWRPNV